MQGVHGDTMRHDPCDTVASPSAAPTRDDVSNFARSLAGMSANPRDPDARAAYLALIAPGETPARAAEMGTMSGCALVARAVLRRFILHPILESPYRDRRAVSDLVEIAEGADAVRRSRMLPAWSALDVGDIVIVGGGDDGGGAEHVWISVGEGEGIDGGQPDENDCQSIILRGHTIAGGWDSTATYRRKVRYVLDVAAILRAFGR
jgi:hypothetical protein